MSDFQLVSVQIVAIWQFSRYPSSRIFLKIHMEVNRFLNYCCFIKDKTDKDNEKKSLKEKMQAMQEITLMVSNIHTGAKSNFWSIISISITK